MRSQDHSHVIDSNGLCSSHYDWFKLFTERVILIGYIVDGSDL
jgi:hypothetical protein